jgi:tetratricopeptide (TPR) repeat protein
LAEQIERLAYHAVRSELNDRTVHYLRQAGVKAVARSALSDARGWYEQALDVLKSLPQTQSRMECAFEVHLELRPVLRQLGERRQMLEHLRKADAISEGLKDDLRRGRVSAFMTTVLSTSDELDEALVTGRRALEIAQRFDDLKLRILTTSYLAQVHYYRGEYESVIALASDSLKALPANWDHEYFGMAVPASVFTRVWLIMSLAELGRFREATDHEATAIRIAESAEHAHSIGWAHFAASVLHLLRGDWQSARLSVEHWLKGDWAKTQFPFEHWINMPWAVASSAWSLAQDGDSVEALNRILKAEQLLENQAASGIGQHRSWAYAALSRAYLLLDRLDDAQRLARRSFESSQHQPGFTAHALCLLGDLEISRDRFDGAEAATHYREASALAQSHGMLPLAAQCHFGLGRLHQRIAEPQKAAEHFSAAAKLYREMDMGFWLERLEAESKDSAIV